METQVKNKRIRQVKGFRSYLRGMETWICYPESVTAQTFRSYLRGMETDMVLDYMSEIDGFRSYLRGMETSSLFLYHWKQKNSDPTYEAWKQHSRDRDMLNKAIPILPTRHGNSRNSMRYDKKLNIPILPTRHGNLYLMGKMVSLSSDSDPTYEAWKPC